MTMKLATISITALAALLAPVAAAQAPAAAPAQAAAQPAAPPYVPTETRAQPNMPRTSFGQPSIEGVWMSNWVLPLEASPRVPMLVVPEAVAKQVALGYAKGVGDALDKQLDPEVPETMRNVEGLPLILGERRTRAVVIPADGLRKFTFQ